MQGVAQTRPAQNAFAPTASHMAALSVPETKLHVLFACPLYNPLRNKYSLFPAGLRSNPHFDVRSWLNNADKQCELASLLHGLQSIRMIET